jgi:hypothetical protein
MRDKIVDMICFTTFEALDVDVDPIIVLPCKHFFATSTLDGHLEINTVYAMDDGLNFTGLKTLIGSSPGIEKPKQCPECRAAIHSVRRYSRFLRLVELRCLERKHVMMAESMIVKLSMLVGEDAAVPSLLDKLELYIRASPMRKVFEACQGDMEISAPPSGPLIRCLELQGLAYSGLCTAYNDGNFASAKSCYEKAIDLADESSSHKSGAQLRLALACFVAKHCRDVQLTQRMVVPLLDWILNHPINFVEVTESATALKKRVLSMRGLMEEELKEILVAMSNSGGYNYGGAASSHWYECPNGHPYFIGECGQAMQTAICPECREPVGGSSHNLLQSNRSATGALRDAFSSLGV